MARSGRDPRSIGTILSTFAKFGTIKRLSVGSDGSVQVEFSDVTAPVPAGLLPITYAGTAQSGDSEAWDLVGGLVGPDHPFSFET
jgi:hypothetical protein